MSWGWLVALLLRAGAASAQPGPDGTPAQPEAGTEVNTAGPQSQAPTRAAFVSTGWLQWDVAIDNQPVCSTPCSLQLFPLQAVTLLSQEPRAVILEVGRLPPGDLVVSGKPLEDGKYVGGIIATTFGGMALATGITLLAVGHAKGRDMMASAGLITGAVGGVTLAGGIYFMLQAMPSVTLSSAAPYGPRAQVGVAGTF